MKEEEPKTKKGNRLAAPFKFDDAMRRLMKVKQPGGGTNEDYVAANKAREKKAS